MAFNFLSVKAFIFLLFCSLARVCQSCTNVTLNCTSTKNDLKCHEVASCLKLHWCEMTPYAYYYEGETTKPYGILLGVTEVLLERCCGKCWSINKTSKPVNFTDFYRAKPNDAEISLPYITSVADVHYRKNYVPVIKDPTSAYVKRKEGWKTLLKNLMSTIFDAWPVLITALLFSWISGMVIWFMEMWLNEEQFPRMFLRGSWEGFWWAFVSMTTVGYGDRSPRTIPGRVFAILWIMIGICICSIFTATLTSALTMDTFNDHKTITRTKIGVMVNSMEAITAVQNQADVYYYNSSDDAWNAVLDGEVDGILLDYYYAVVHEEELRKDNLMVVNVFKPKDWSMGVHLRSEELADCMRDEYYHDYARILYDAIVNESISEPTKTAYGSQTSVIFDPSGAVFKTILLVATGGACMMFIAGICLDFVCRGKKLVTDCVSEKVKKLDNVENELVSELHAVFMNWKERKAGTAAESFALQSRESKA